MKIQERVLTPCIGLCSTTYGDSVCKGCKRFAHEIVDWNRYDEPQKIAVIARLTQLMTNVVSRYLLVIDSSLLRSALDGHSLRYRADQPPECWAYDLFRQTKGRFAHLTDLGLAKLPEVAGMKTTDLWEQINKDFLAISEGHYERYFMQPLSFD